MYTNNTNNEFIANTIITALKDNKSITTSCFLPAGEITSTNKHNATVRMDEYKTKLVTLANSLEKYALYYYNGNGKSNISVIANNCIDVAKILFIELEFNRAMYVAKMLITLIHSFKRTSSYDLKEKHFAADFTANAIKRPFERALFESGCCDYACAHTKRTEYNTDRAIKKQRAKCVNNAKNSRKKALDTQFEKYAEMLKNIGYTVEKIEEEKTTIYACYVEVIPSDGEKAIDVPKGTISTDITPTTEKTEKTA